METSDRPKLTLPENAYRKLNAGEEYQPIVPADRPLPEATPYSVGWGLFYAVLFSAGAAYLGLKIGQVFEAAIPIAILAVGASAALKRKNALSENVIIQSIGAASGVIVAGAIFTLPGLYILGLQASFLQVFLSSLLGGFLGILFLIPFRRFFVKDMHGEFPFPEATATTEILVAGEAGGDQASILLGGAVVGGVYDFLVSGLGAWKEVVSTTVFGWGQRLADTIKWEFRINVGAAVTGLGYIIGLRYAAIICAGSFTAWWVLVPLVYFIGSHVGEPFATRSGLTIAQMPPIQIFADYVRHVGIGGIAAAGIIGVLKSWRIIVGAFKLALREFTGGVHAAAGKTERTQTDIAMKWVTTAILATIIGTFVFFRFSVVDSLFHAVVGLIVVTVIAFLFTTVAARAIAIVGVNPVSGMTLMTLIISSVVLLQVGVTGRTGILAALIIGGVVCTALSMAGGFITDLKIGYWLGTTPRTQERWKFLGTLAAAASVGVVIMMLDQVDGFGAPTALHPASARRPSGIGDGRRDRAADDGSAGSLAALHCRDVSCLGARDRQRPSPRLCPRHVPSDRAQHAAPLWRSGRVVRVEPEQGRQAEHRAARAWNADRVRLHRRRRDHGRHCSDAQLHRGQQDRSGMATQRRAWPCGLGGAQPQGRNAGFRHVRSSAHFLRLEVDPQHVAAGLRPRSYNS